MCRFGSYDKFGGNIGLQIFVLWRVVSVKVSLYRSMGCVTIKLNVVHSQTPIENLQWYLSSILRLSKDLNNSLNPFDHLSFDDCCKRDSG